MLLAFHNDPKIKEKFINRVKRHQELDNIKQGFYWVNGKGGAVGCTLEMAGGRKAAIHMEYEKQLGIPAILALLQDKIFEGLSLEDSKKFPLNFLSSIRIGADLSGVWPKFAIWLLEDQKYGVIQYANSERAKLAIKEVIEIYLQNKHLNYTITTAVDTAYLTASTASEAYAAAAASVVASSYARPVGVCAAVDYAVWAAECAFFYNSAASKSERDAFDQNMSRIQAEKLIELLREA